MIAEKEQRMAIAQEIVNNNRLWVLRPTLKARVGTMFFITVLLSGIAAIFFGLGGETQTATEVSLAKVFYPLFNIADQTTMSIRYAAMTLIGIFTMGKLFSLLVFIYNKKYVITASEIEGFIGIFAKDKIGTTLDQKILTKTYKTVLGRILGYGTLVIITNASSNMTSTDFFFTDIENPEAMGDIIEYISEINTRPV